MTKTKASLNVNTGTNSSMMMDYDHVAGLVGSFENEDGGIKQDKNDGDTKTRSNNKTRNKTRTRKTVNLSINMQG